MNVERLITLKNVILKYSSKFNYQCFRKMVEVEKLTQQESTDIFHTCGTVGCVAGYAVAVFSPEKYILWETNIEQIAEELLELTPLEAEWLFFPWYYGGEDKEHTAEDAINRLNWLIDGNSWKTFPENTQELLEN